MNKDDIKNITDDKLIDSYCKFLDKEEYGQRFYPCDHREMQEIDDELTRRGIDVDLINAAKQKQYSYRKLRMYEFSDYPAPLTVKEALRLGTTECPEPIKKLVTTIQEPYEDYGIGELDENLRSIAVESVSKIIKNSSQYFPVIGDSMIGAGINHGDNLIIDTDFTTCENQIVVARIWKRNYLIKRLIRNNGDILLRSENPLHKDIKVTDDMELEVLGVVTGKISKI